MLLILALENHVLGAKMFDRRWGPLRIISEAAHGPPLGEEVAASPSSDEEAVLLRAVVTPPESIYSKCSGLSSAQLGKEIVREPPEKEEVLLHNVILNSERLSDKWRPRPLGNIR